MKAACLVVVLAVCATPVCSQELVFAGGFESGDTAGWWAPARVGETGQLTCYDEAGAVVDCAGTGQDGEIKEVPGLRILRKSEFRKVRKPGTRRTPQTSTR